LQKVVSFFISSTSLPEIEPLQPDSAASSTGTSISNLSRIVYCAGVGPQPRLFTLPRADTIFIRGWTKPVTFTLFSAEPEPDPVSLDVTMIAPTAKPNAMVPTEETPSTETVEPQPQDSTATVVVRPAKLTIEGEGLVFSLGPFNEIGRAVENQIQLKYAGISKKHALIAATPEGYTVRDLNSRYGIFVNDKKVSECNLSDGDSIRIGEIHLMFHET
jgi:hypothetical protein